MTEEWQMIGMTSLEEADMFFDIFFIYKTNDTTSSWVRNTCRDLEKIHIVPGYHERDFIIGRSISDNIENCIIHSKKVRIVITPDFHESHWCNVDLDIAFTNNLKYGEGKIFPLFLNVTPQEISKKLGIYTGIDVGGPRDEWWEKLVAAVRDSHSDAGHRIKYHLQKTMEACIMNESTESAIISIDRLLRSPLDQLLCQIEPDSNKPSREGEKKLKSELEKERQRHNNTVYKQHEQFLHLTQKIDSLTRENQHLRIQLKYQLDFTESTINGTQYGRIYCDLTVCTCEHCYQSFYDEKEQIEHYQKCAP